jgi:LacI family transcriptional regulator
VARLAGVSPATVSRVLNGNTSVAPELAERVKQAVRSLEQGTATAGLPTARKIGVGFPRRIEAYDPDPMGGAFYGQVLSGIHEVLSEGGHELSFFPFDAGDAADWPIRQYRERFDGLVLMGADVPDEMARQLQQQNLPIIVVDKQVRGVDSVVSDNVGGAEEVTTHVIQAGYTHLIYLCETLDDPSFAARRQGFERAVELTGNPAIQSSVLEVGRGWLEAHKVLGSLEDIWKLPVGIIAGNDMTALHVLALLRAKGLSVPDQVGLAGFDDVALASKVDPPLTTVRVDKMEMGRLAARRLLERISMPDLLPITITMHVALAVRESTHLGGSRPH